MQVQMALWILLHGVHKVLKMVESPAVIVLS